MKMRFASSQLYAVSIVFLLIAIGSLIQKAAANKKIKSKDFTITCHTSSELKCKKFCVQKLPFGSTMTLSLLLSGLCWSTIKPTHIPAQTGEYVEYQIKNKFGNNEILRLKYKTPDTTDTSSQPKMADFEYAFEFPFSDIRESTSTLDLVFGNAGTVKINLLDSFTHKYWPNCVIRPANIELYKEAYSAWMELQKVIETAQKKVQHPKPFTMSVARPHKRTETRKMRKGQNVGYWHLPKKIIKYISVTLTENATRKSITFYVLNSTLTFFLFMDEEKPCTTVCQKYKWEFTSRLIYCCDFNDIQNKVGRREDVLKFSTTIPDITPLVIKKENKHPELMWNGVDEYPSSNPDTRYYLCSPNENEAKSINGAYKEYKSEIYVLDESNCKWKTHLLFAESVGGETTKQIFYDSFGIVTCISSEKEKQYMLPKNENSIKKQYIDDLVPYTGTLIPTYDNLWFIKLYGISDTQGEIFIYETLLRVETAKTTVDMSEELLLTEPPNWTSKCRENNKYYHYMYDKDNFDTIYKNNVLDQTTILFVYNKIRDGNYLKYVSLVSPRDMPFEGINGVAPTCNAILMWSKVHEKYWLKIEQAVRHMAIEFNEDIIVYIGYEEPLTFKKKRGKKLNLAENVDSGPVYLYGLLYKFVVTAKGTLFIFTINNVLRKAQDSPFYGTKMPCTERCARLYGVTLGEDDLIWCCEIPDMEDWPKMYHRFLISQNQEAGIKLKKTEREEKKLDWISSAMKKVTSFGENILS